ncbi:hypothetical protein EVG20_g10915 [Dentipellis fragilis]|uniref:Uncharacterized protein n=1 Tax=Dentipellis fragilis TaxID=205917 RepID=A0A4Y9XSX5_9AGAM|nr:hypothetical protein EVG20_g10915 [Dentipellis fragilis]
MGRPEGAGDKEGTEGAETDGAPWTSGRAGENFESLPSPPTCFPAKSDTPPPPCRPRSEIPPHRAHLVLISGPIDSHVRMCSATSSLIASPRSYARVSRPPSQQDPGTPRTSASGDVDAPPGKLQQGGVKA